MQDKTLFKQAMTYPAKIFASPQKLAEDERFSADEKLALLESWTVDATALMRAEAENMGPDTKAGKGSKLLELINEAKIKIKS